ncbi:MAG: glutamyl-tRNA reductase [Candidatus Cyclobacteriaceae bacterium M3_2C_046]
MSIDKMNEFVPLGLIGVSHKTAPVEIRDQVALNEEEQQQAIKSIIQQFEVDGCMIISTCNRTEIYLSADEVEKQLGQVAQWFDQLKGNHLLDQSDYAYQLVGFEAVSHYFKVISGIDSQIVGETQISGQVRDSYEMAHQLNATDSILNKLFNFAMQAKKQVWNETFLCDGTVSVSFAGVELARKIFNQLQQKEILVLGAGKTAELAAYYFVENEVKHIHVINRTFENAQKLADSYNGKAYPMDQLPDVLKRSDILISATASQQHVITAELMKQIMKERHHQPIFMIDLAMPRDIDPLVQEIDGVFLYNLDDLQEVVEMNLEKRKKEIPKSIRIVEEYVLEFKKWYSKYSMATVAGKLKKQLDILRLNEIERFKNGFTGENLKEINYLTESIINKIVRQHVKMLKKNADDPIRYQQHLEMIYHLFDSEK